MKKFIQLLIILISLCLSSHAQVFFNKVMSGPVVTTTNASNRCTFGDYDNDGYIDIVVSTYNDGCVPCTYPVLVYRNITGGSFVRITTGIIATYTDRTFGLAWGDYDNDGRLDLFLCVGFNGNNLLFHNDGNGNFTRITTGIIVNDGGFSQACSWGDYDRDGWLDLFVANSNLQKNYLYKNNGNGTFTKITTGNIVNDTSYSRGCAWGDYNNDGWPDIFVVNYYGMNDFLYRNNGNGTFTKITTGPHVNDGLWGSGCTWGDYDNDGYLDLYVTHNSTNNRLFHNNGDGTFTYFNSGPSTESGLSFGASWGDYDNDGYLDLMVPKEQTLNALYKNNSGTTFTKILSEVPAQEGGNSVSNTWGDIDNDGKLDLFVTNNTINSLNFFYRNIGPTQNYLICKLVGGCGSNVSAIGARIIAYSGNFKVMREISGGQQMGSQDMLFQHFGLGNRTLIDSLIVYWPAGNSPKIQRLINVSVNQTLLLDECLIGIEQNGTPAEYRLYQNYPNPFNPSTTIEYVIPKATHVNIELYDITGRFVRDLKNEFQMTGHHKFDFNGDGLASGIYIYKISTSEFTETKKMILIK